MSWKLEFDRPVRLKDGSEIRTLAEARSYILSLPDDQHKTPAVTVAIECLLMAAEKRGPLLHAQIGMIQLIHGKPDGRIERKPKLKIGKRLPR